MHTIIRKLSNHHWVKKNLVTIQRGKKHWDELECEKCGIKGKMYNLTEIEIPSKYNKKKVDNCPFANATNSKRIKITQCTAQGLQFSNLVPDSEHDVINTPSGENNNNGVWVMGVGEPVKVLNTEFLWVDNV